MQSMQSMPSQPPPPPPKSEKSKVKLFSRPGKISTKGDIKDKPLPSPNKMGISSALASLQRGNFSTTSLDTSNQTQNQASSSFYNLANSSAATIRATDSATLTHTNTGSSLTLIPTGSGATSSSSAAASFVERPDKDGKEKEGKEGKDKEKKHHFLSRQKHKLKDKDDFHLPLSSAASNSRPTDPNAPSSLYNFSLPPNSPGPNTDRKSVV